MYLLIRSTEQIRCVNVKGNTRVLTKAFYFSFQYKALVFTLLLTNHQSL